MYAHELSQWQCHKKVSAAQIDAINDRTNGGARLALAGGHTLQVDDAWLTKHQPRVGGYYVIYEDGYASYSPQAAFEGGYTLVSKPFKENEMKDCHYKPSGELQGDSKSMPDKGTSTGFGDNAQLGGMSTDADATNSMGKITGATKSDSDSTKFGGDDRVLKTLDKSRDYGICYGATDGRIYEQDGVSFTAEGKEWTEPGAEPVVKPSKARAIHAAQPAAPPPADDQLAAQLKG